MDPEITHSFHCYMSEFKKTENCITCFTILNTAKKINQYYFTPIRIFDNIQVGGVVVSNSIEARQFAAAADGKFDYIAADSEKKIEFDRYVHMGDLGNICGEVLDTVKKSKVIMIKANDITVNAIDVFVSDRIINIPSKKVAVVGTGNIGFKISLRLVEGGCWVNMYRRDKEKLKIQSDCINLTKPKGTIAKAYPADSLADCLKDVHAVIAVSSASNIISIDDLKGAHPNVVLIDCGKNCFSRDVYANYTVYRTDVGMALIYQLKLVIESQRHLHPRFGKKRVEGKTYVCGVSGLEGNVVLQDINNLDLIIGICDGRGGVRYNLHREKYDFGHLF